MKIALLLILGLFASSNASAESSLPFRLQHNVNSGTVLVPIQAPKGTRDSNGYRKNGLTVAVDNGSTTLSKLDVAVYDAAKVVPGRKMTVTANTTSNAGQADEPSLKDPFTFSISCGELIGSSCEITGSFSNDPMDGVGSIGADDTISFQYSLDGTNWTQVTDRDLNASRSFFVTSISDGQSVMVRYVVYKNNVASPAYSIGNNKNNPLPSCLCASI